MSLRRVRIPAWRDRTERRVWPRNRVARDREYSNRYECGRQGQSSQSGEQIRHLWSFTREPSIASIVRYLTSNSCNFSYLRAPEVIPAPFRPAWLSTVRAAVLFYALHQRKRLEGRHNSQLDPTRAYQLECCHFANLERQCFPCGYAWPLRLNCHTLEGLFRLLVSVLPSHPVGIRSRDWKFGVHARRSVRWRRPRWLRFLKGGPRR